ncbi:MAG TPA: lysozyme inhibitor LprI family protein [Trichocoleus sp.]
MGGAVPIWAADEAQAPSLPGVVAPHCPEETQQGRNRCTGLWLRTAEYHEALVYDDLKQTLDLSDRVQLAIAEEHWRAFRDLQCEAESTPFNGGSIYSQIHGTCMAQAANDRTGDLQQWGNPEISQQAAETRLQALLTQMKLTDSPAQKQWEAYRNLHCDFEANYRDDVPTQYQQCVSRLTQTRIARLEAWAAQRNP